MNVYSQRSLLQLVDNHGTVTFVNILLCSSFRDFRDLFATMLRVPLPDCFWCSLQVMNRSNELWISPVSLCVIHNGLGPGSEVGGGGGGRTKKIGERSERESLGRDKDEGVRPPSPLPSPPLGLLGLPIFCCFIPFLLIPSTTEPGPNWANVI